MRLRALSLVALVGFVNSAQSQQPVSSPFQTSGAFFALSVPNLDDSVRWYSDTFGLAVTMRPPRNGHSMVAVLEGSGLMVELLQDDEAVSLQKAAPGIVENYRVHGIFKAGFIVNDFDEAVAALRRKGVEIVIGPFPSRPDQRANLAIRDNNGNLIMLVGR